MLAHASVDSSVAVAELEEFLSSGVIELFELLGIFLGGVQEHLFVLLMGAVEEGEGPAGVGGGVEEAPEEVLFFLGKTLVVVEDGGPADF